MSGKYDLLVLLYETKDVSTVARNRADNIGGVRTSDQPQPDGSDWADHNPVNIAATLGAASASFAFPYDEYTTDAFSKFSKSSPYASQKLTERRRTDGNHQSQSSPDQIAWQNRPWPPILRSSLRRGNTHENMSSQKLAD